MEDTNQPQEQTLQRIIGQLEKVKKGEQTVQRLINLCEDAKKREQAVQRLIKLCEEKIELIKKSEAAIAEIEAELQTFSR